MRKSLPIGSEWDPRAEGYHQAVFFSFARQRHFICNCADRSASFAVILDLLSRGGCRPDPIAQKASAGARHALRHGFEGDAVAALTLERGESALLGPFGLTPVVGVVAELLVGRLAGEEMVGHDEDGVRHGDHGLLVAPVPHDAPIPHCQGSTAVPDGPQGGFGERRPEPWVALPRLAGASLAAATPISARITSAVRRLTPGMVLSRSTASAMGAISCSTRAHVDRLLEVVQGAEDLADQKGMVGAEAAGQGLPKRRELLPQGPARQVGEDGGSVVPRKSASRIARPEAPRTSVATEASLMSASSRTL